MYSFNSPLILSKSSKASLPSKPDISTICIKTLVLSTCLKKSWPKPTPSAAPSIRPGISAKTKLSPNLVWTTPKLGVNVVKW